MKKFIHTYALFVAIISCGPTAHGQVGWQWAVGSTFYGAYAQLYDGVHVTADRFGNVFCTGVTIHTNSASFGAITITNPQVFITKADAAGNYQWALSIPAAQVMSMVADATGDLYAWTLTGLLGGTALIKINASGSYVWEKQLPDTAARPEIWGTFEGGNSVGIDGTGNIYVAGGYAKDTFFTDSFSALFLRYNGAFIAKYDSSGNLIWIDRLSGGNIPSIDNMAVSADGTIYVIGSFADTLSLNGSPFLTSTRSGQASYLLKLDSSGHLAWAIQDSNILNPYTSALATDMYDRIYMSLIFAGTISFAGKTFTPPAASGGNLLLICRDSSAAAIWAQPIYFSPGTSDIIRVDNCGNLCITDMIYPYIGFTLFGTDTLFEPPDDVGPLYVATYDTAGNYLSGTAIATGSLYPYDMCLDKKGSFFLAGEASDTLIVSSDTIYPSNSNLFITKYLYDTDICAAEISQVHNTPTPQHTVILYPNPATSSCTIESGTAFGVGATLQLFDMAGTRVGTYVLIGCSSDIPLGNLAPGMYLCRITLGDGSVVTRKLILE